MQTKNDKFYKDLRQALAEIVEYKEQQKQQPVITSRACSRCSQESDYFILLNKIDGDNVIGEVCLNCLLDISIMLQKQLTDFIIEEFTNHKEV